MSKGKHPFGESRTGSPINVPSASPGTFRTGRGGIVVPTVNARATPIMSPADATSFKGRGPKGYSRSDTHIRHALEEALAADPTLDASEIVVEVASGKVTLTGTVAGQRARHAARAIAASVVGAGGVKETLKTKSGE